MARAGRSTQAYQERLQTLNAVDFGDLLCLPIRMFRANPDVLKEYQQKFRFILVDEYQDTNTAQYMWLRLLAQRPAGERPNICCVGDDDQSIYGWRGAEVENILRFEKDFPGAKVIRLERNYRSTEHILGAAGHLIAHNEGRLGKTLFTEQSDPEHERVMVHAAWDSEEEARAIGEEIEQAQIKGRALNNMAILVRASFQMREFEERFVTLGLNYRVIGGPRFYERQEIRDAMAFFRVVCQPADDLAFERIVNVPKRGLGEAAVRKVHDVARARGIPMLAAARELILTDEMKPKPRKSLTDVVEMFTRWQTMLETTPGHELAETILEESGYTEMWQNDRAADAPTRLENLKELVETVSR
jgi:DNA helicase-2/ATP-dependent DNA helicase PcrA